MNPFTDSLSFSLSLSLSLSAMGKNATQFGYFNFGFLGNQSPREKKFWVQTNCFLFKILLVSNPVCREGVRKIHKNMNIEKWNKMTATFLRLFSIS